MLSASMRSNDNLLVLTERGLYCPPGDFYIDPRRSVDYAVITHAHSDHAFPGSRNYLSTRATSILLKARIGKNIITRGVAYGETVVRNSVQISFHPAGHIPGSAQVRIEYKGEVWVVTGDYKTEHDGFTENFETIPCHTFITETTFALPLYHWRPQTEVTGEINRWWESNRTKRKISVIYAYSLGKAQRILQALNPLIGEIYASRPVIAMNDAVEEASYKLNSCKLFNPAEKLPEGFPLIITPQLSGEEQEALQTSDIGFASVSGWNQIQKRRNKNTDSFVLSDHADWQGLISAVKSSGAEQVFTMHGYTKQFARYLRESGIEADEISALHQ